MFTKVFYQSLAGFLIHTSPTGLPHKTPLGVDRKNSHSLYAFVSRFRDALSAPITDSKTGSYYNGVAFGDGNTPVKSDDYCLSGNHFTTYALSYAASISEDFTEVTYLYTLTNNGTEAFTVKEVGMFGCTSNSKDYAALLYREVLDTPVTIEPGGVGQVTVTFKINIPES